MAYSYAWIQDLCKIGSGRVYMDPQPDLGVARIRTHYANGQCTEVLSGGLAIYI